MSSEMRTPSGPQRMKIFVGNLLRDVESHELRKLFERYGVVTECRVHHRYGFVNMKTEEMVTRAIEKLNNTEFMGVRIRVEKSTRKMREGSWIPRGCMVTRKRGRPVPYIRPQAEQYDRRPGIPSFARDSFNYYGRARGPPMYHKGKMPVSDIESEKYSRGGFGRGEYNSHDNTWMGPASFDSSDESDSQITSGIYGKIPKQPPSEFENSHSGTEGMDSQAPPFRR